jgi:hypothetical protein
MVFEKSRLSKQLRQLEESARELISLLKQLTPLAQILRSSGDPRIWDAFIEKLSREIDSELTGIGRTLEGCGDKKCLEEVEKSLARLSQRITALRGEVDYLRKASELELIVLFRKLFECKGAPPQVPLLSSVLLLCYVEACLAKTERELGAAKADLHRLRASEEVHPRLRGAWERLLQREEELLSSAEKELAEAKEIAHDRPCETLKMLSSIARAAYEFRIRCEEYDSLKVEFFSPKAIEGFIPPRAKEIFKSEEEVKRMLNKRAFERLFSAVYRTLTAEEAEREVERILSEFAKCIWYEINR